MEILTEWKLFFSFFLFLLALNAYMIYCQENRDRIKSENPSAKMGEISKLLAEAYKNLSSHEVAALENKVLILMKYIMLMDNGTYSH